MAKAGYDFYMGQLLLPVTPEKLTMKMNGQNKTVNLINEGEINILKSPGLTDIEFECDIPQVKHPYAVYPSGFRGADYYLSIFEQCKVQKMKFQFIVCRKAPNGKNFFSCNIKCTLEDYKITEDAKEGFDLRVKITLKQWRDYGTKTVKIAISSQKVKAKAAETREIAEAPVPKASQSYTVVKGDSLWKIAKKFYGNGSQYTKILNANKDKIKNADLIYPNQVLTIPAA